MEILSFSTNGFGYIDIFSLEMKDSNIICGDHGKGKTQAILAVMSALSDVEYKSIDNPITKGKKRHENIVNLKVDPGDEITLMDHVFRCNVGDNITVSLIKTPSGSPKLTLFNSTTGEQYKGTTTETRKIVDKFLGRFPDPKKLDDLATGTRGEREEFVKMVASMSKTKEGELIDFSPFIELEKTLNENHANYKANLKVLRDDEAAMARPQPDWATEGINQKAVSDEIQRFNAHEIENTRRLQVIQESERKLTDQKQKLDELEVQKKNMTSQIEVFSNGLGEERVSIQNLEKSIISYQENNQIVKAEDTDILTSQIESLQKRLKVATDLKEKNQKVKENISVQQNKVTTRKQLADKSKESIVEKQNTLTEISEKCGTIALNYIPDTKKEIETIKENNQPLLWTGQRDPKEILEPLPFLNKLMSDAVLANKQVDDREKFEGQGKKIEATEKQMKETTESKNQVKADEKLVIESSVFPHPGIQIRRGDDNKVNVWVKDPNGAWNTYNDTNHAHRLFYATNIVTHGVGGDLKLLVVREGYALHDYMQKMIIDTANRKGFKVMLETLVSTDENAIYLGESEKPQEIVSAPLKDGESPAFGPTPMVDAVCNKLIEISEKTGVDFTQVSDGEPVESEDAFPPVNGKPAFGKTK